MADDNLHNNGSLKASTEYSIDRIQNAAVGEWVKSRQTNVEDGEEADHTTSEGASSAVVTYWKDGSAD